MSDGLKPGDVVYLEPGDFEDGPEDTAHVVVEVSGQLCLVELRTDAVKFKADSGVSTQRVWAWPLENFERVHRTQADATRGAVRSQLEDLRNELRTLEAKFPDLK